MRPILKSPKNIIISPAILDRMDIFDEIKMPSQVADAPKRINTIENPIIKNIALIKMMRLSLLIRTLLPSAAFISSRENPEINEIYPGIRGGTQGDKNEIKPAAKAMYMETSYVMNYLYNTLGVPRVRSA